MSGTSIGARGITPVSSLGSKRDSGAPAGDLAAHLRLALRYQFQDARLQAEESYRLRPLDGITTILVHHSGDPNLHQHPPGCLFHFRITPSGKVVYLNGIAHKLQHSGDPEVDASSVAVCFQGDFESDHPTPQALTAFSALKSVLERYLT